MIDLDTLVAAFQSEAAKAGYTCDPARASLLLVVEEPLTGHPNEGTALDDRVIVSLQLSLASLQDVPAGTEAAFAADRLATTKPHFE